MSQTFAAPARPRRCPSCLFDLAGVSPNTHADPTGELPFICPECGSTVTRLAAEFTAQMDPTPGITFTLLLISALSIFIMCGSCLIPFGLSFL